MRAGTDTGRMGAVTSAGTAVRVLPIVIACVHVNLRIELRVICGHLLVIDVRADCRKGSDD